MTDLNGDGWDDLIVGARVFLNEQGVLQARAQFPGNLRPRDVTQADITGDGRLDLMVYDPDHWRILVYPGRAR